MREPSLTGFAPIVGSTPRVLILGSMPSRKSLQQTEYYAHPQNSFWWIMGKIIGFERRLDYSSRVELVRRADIAIWDVLLDCDRPGSLDSRIVRGSELLNDLSGFFSSHPALKLIAFNGGVAKTLFMRHCQDNLDQQAQSKTLVQLPSTSSAYASMTRVDKLRVWSAEIKPYLSD